MQNPQPLSQQSVTEIVIHSPPVEDLSLLPGMSRSLLLAELAMIAYLPQQEVEKLAASMGYTEVLFFDNDGSQAYSFANEVNIIIACRGTEPNEWNDLKADMDATKAVAETIGRVHRGFKKEVDDLWPLLEKMLISNTRKLWFTGHSLGGAMATICAGRCLLSHINTVPEQLCTFGSPRVGNKRYINYANIDYYRWVNNNDIVTRSPPAWMGYRHTGTEMYLNSEGKLKKLNSAQRSADLWKGFVMGLKKKEIDHFSDHSINRYIQYIYDEVHSRGDL
ncbi:MAG: lipase family protein [Thiotrichaceae bacterium]|nr:lipase family protein [Thiotrichaceae bacterium]